MGSKSLLLRVDSLYLVGTSAVAFLAGTLGMRVAGVGFADAHELALFAGLLLWVAAPRACWHLSAAGVHALFAAANMAHWQSFVSAEIVPVGYVTTAMHLLFVALQVFKARSAASSRSLAAEVVVMKDYRVRSADGTGARSHGAGAGKVRAAAGTVGSDLPAALTA
jgi:hypothetical protein